MAVTYPAWTKHVLASVSRRIFLAPSMEPGTGCTSFVDPNWGVVSEPVLDEPEPNSADISSKITAGAATAWQGNTLRPHDAPSLDHMEPLFAALRGPDRQTPNCLDARRRCNSSR
ncbi:hypothetical protein JDV02_010187 [Purpureocillium takamizusanense]|uniref:Uncharacterized protein n=1 Tax=Purpureocillium takamizusanense TaxID=2060973 RepID=A0A9Q8QNG9_9HYPO|nr:uncharacterized protein JDV02_010187 [Purpureocillium takamizusanense]UNI24444.1 hypothetical protein JDV02_010187 [Purpureocillium takamizusanense]